MNNATDKIVYFIRHGQSEGNAAPVFQAPESPLSELGKEQAKRIAKRVKKIDFEVLISSPYPRAKQTAEAITNLTGKVPVFSELFIERKKPTSVDGKSYDDVTANNTFNSWKKSLENPGMRVEDGENFEEITHRADQALDFLVSRPEKTLLVVTHGYFLKTVIAKVLLGDQFTPETFSQFHRSTYVENTSVSALQFGLNRGKEPMWWLWILNDHAHLG